MYHVWVYRHVDDPARPWVLLGELRQSDGSCKAAEAVCAEYNARHGHLGLRYEVQAALGRSSR